MATVKVMLKENYTGKDGTFPIIIRVEHAGRRKKIPVGYKVDKKFWKAGQVTSKHPECTLINAAIAAKESEIRRYLADCDLRGSAVNIDLIGTGRTSYSFTEYLDHRATQYKAQGKIVMRRKVERFAKELRECYGRLEVLFDELTADGLRDLDNWMIKNGNVNNTRHKKFKFLGEFYGHAKDEGKATGPNLLKQYKIVRKPVKKEKLTEAEIKAIEDLHLLPGPVADARNLFLFSYYAKGNRFENCIMLRREQISQGRIFFRTNKGNDHISVKIHARLQAILNLYSKGKYVFPYVKERPADPEAYLKMVDSRNVIVNRNLKIVAAAAEIEKPLKFHIARHSFADHLMKKSKKVAVVQESLGHSEERTTKIYIDALGDEILDPEMDKLYGE